MAKIYIDSINLCSRRLIDLKKIYNYFILNGHDIVVHKDRADYIILYTCGFDRGTQNEGIRRIKELNSQFKSKLIVAGCLPNINIYKVREVFDGPIIEHRHEEKLDSLFYSKVKFCEVKEAHSLYKRFKHDKIARFFQHFLGKSRRFPFEQYCIQVGKGCLHRCSYCVDKLTVGNLISRPLNEVLADFELGLKRGYRNFRLLADDFSAYGQDIGTNFIELLEKLTSHKGDYTIWIEETNAYWLIKYKDEFCNLIERAGSKFVFWTLAFQSGSDRILELMKRGYTRAELLSLLEKLKGKIPLHCHIIVGFPTETESEFMSSIDLIEKADFDLIDIFIYSDMEGAPSFTLYPKVPEEEKRRRLGEAQNLLLKKGYFLCRHREGHQFTFAKRGIKANFLAFVRRFL